MNQGLRHAHQSVNGGGGIRTHGGFHLAGFQDRSHQPLDHPSKEGRAGAARQKDCATAEQALQRDLKPQSQVGLTRQGDMVGVIASPLMAVLSTDFLAIRTRKLAEMIQTLPQSACPEHQRHSCRELLAQLCSAIETLSLSERVPDQPCLANGSKHLSESQPAGPASTSSPRS